MDSLTNLLVGVLAQTDALHEPLRDWSSPCRNAAVLARRQTYFHEGLPYSLGGGDAAERQRAVRLADALENENRAIFHRNDGVRVAWRLADAEQFKLRSMCLLTGEREMLRAMAGLLDNATTAITDPIAESTLAGEEVKSRHLLVEECFLPALSLGLVTSSSDAAGRVYYSLSPAGWRYVETWKPARPKRTTFNRSQSLAAAELYLTSIRAARRELRSLRGETAHIAIPLSCGLAAHDNGLAILDKAGKLIP